MFGSRNFLKFNIFFDLCVSLTNFFYYIFYTQLASPLFLFMKGLVFHGFPLASVSSLILLLVWPVVLVTSKSSGPVGCLHWGFGILCGLGDSGTSLVPGTPSTNLSSGKSEVY